MWTLRDLSRPISSLRVKKLCDHKLRRWRRRIFHLYPSFPKPIKKSYAQTVYHSYRLLPLGKLMYNDRSCLISSLSSNRVILAPSTFLLGTLTTPFVPVIVEGFSESSAFWLSTWELPLMVCNFFFSFLRVAFSFFSFFLAVFPCSLATDSTPTDFFSADSTTDTTGTGGRSDGTDCVTALTATEAFRGLDFTGCKCGLEMNRLLAQVVGVAKCTSRNR